MILTGVLHEVIGVVNTEHRAPGWLGLAWIWRVQQGAGLWQPLLQLVCKCTLPREEKHVMIIVRMIGTARLSGLEGIVEGQA